LTWYQEMRSGSLVEAFLFEGHDGTRGSNLWSSICEFFLLFGVNIIAFLLVELHILLGSVMYTEYVDTSDFIASSYRGFIKLHATYR
jgi:hypothetical protein